ncbi:MAG TPA: OsmC family protein [Haliangiales bacterium]|nr:OsmC family protein [Haliangiales bacterium]
MKRTAQAVWLGELRDGEGHLTTGSHVLSDARYSFTTRFGEERGTNPEELIAAAHAGCFSMALAFGLGNAGWPPASIRTAAELSLERDASGPAITGIHLSVVARVPGVGDADFQRIAEEAKRGCLVSRLLDTPITMTARLDPDA